MHGLNTQKGHEDHVVYGMLYTLEPDDEENLDIAEGVPYAYFKRELDVELVSKEVGDGSEKGETVKALVYVDEKRLGEGVCKEEYVARINRGVRDAVWKGMSKEYVEMYIKPFVREEEVDDETRVKDPFHPNNSKAYDEEDL